MRQIQSSTQSLVQLNPGEDTAADEQHRMVRGLVHGVILSLVLWVAIGYGIFILH